MQALERFDTVVAVMTEQEARACVTRINTHMNSARLELLLLYEGRGWQALGYASWRECVTAEFGDSERHLYRQLAAAEIERRIDPGVKIGTLPEKQLRPLARLTPLEQPMAWNEANARTDGKPTAKVVEQVVREMRGEVHAPEEDELDPPMELEQVADQFPHELTPTDKALLSNSTPAAPRVNAGLFTSATPEWYTPKHIVDRVIRVFDGYISLDPCSNSNDPGTANVPALDYWTQADDGLLQPWHGSVYMNPPYGDVIGEWVERMCDAYESGEIDAAIGLLPGRIDTAWFQLLNRYPICCVRGRLRFSGSENSAPFPSVVVYLGRDINAFIAQFRDIGPIRPAVVEAT
jgi:hypothetical protein